MRKKILSLGVLMASMSALADNTTSPYTGSTVGTWLQNNDSRANLWHTHANIGTRGIDFTIESEGNSYKIKTKFKNNPSFSPVWQSVEDNCDQAWTVEPSTLIDGVPNGYTLGGYEANYTADNGGQKGPATHYLRSALWRFPNQANNLFYTATATDADRWTLEDPYWTVLGEKKTRSVWQFVTREERINVMQAQATSNTPQDASWLIPGADFANQDTRITQWTVNGFSRQGDGNTEWRRGNMVMGGNNIVDGGKVEIKLTGIPNGLYRFCLQGFYRDGGYTDVVARREAGTEQMRVSYYANDVKHPLMSILDEPACQGTNLEGPLTVTAGNYRMPNTGQEATEMINCWRAFVNPDIEVMVNDGTLTLGVIKEGDAVDEWCMVDNFHLTYLGTDRQIINEANTCRTVPAADVTVTLARQLSADNWNTFCVPFSMTAEQVTTAFGNGTEIRKMKNVEGSVMNFEAATTIEAGVPCLVKPGTTTGTTITVSGVTMTNLAAQSVGDENYKFIGTYSPVSLATDGTNLFLQSNGKLAKPAASSNTMKGMRAYFHVPAGTNARISIDGNTTGVEELKDSRIKSKSVYDLGGRKIVKPSNKGIFIQNGKKYHK